MYEFVVVGVGGGGGGGGGVLLLLLLFCLFLVWFGKNKGCTSGGVYVPYIYMYPR